MITYLSAQWDLLQDDGLAGDLHPIFERLTSVAFSSKENVILGARNDILAAVMHVRTEKALASGLYILTQIAGYQFTGEEKNLWNKRTEILGFSNIIHLQ